MATWCPQLKEALWLNRQVFVQGFAGAVGGA